MPKKLEEKIRKSINKQYPDASKKKKDALVYSILRKTGWVPGKGDMEDYTEMPLTKDELAYCDQVYNDMYKEVK